jgi:hypothetical protein
MVIHCALSAQHLHKFANNDPYLLVGDFNIKPGEREGRGFSYVCVLSQRKRGCVCASCVFERRGWEKGRENGCMREGGEE